MAKPRTISLEAIRTDGWFERIGESIGSFQALCEIIGERFFAFSLVAGVRISALTVDRRSPDATIVEFLAGDEAAETARRASLPEFRRQLVGALLTTEATGPVPVKDTDVEAIQAHLGVRYLLLAPLFGLSVKRLSIDEHGESTLQLSRDGFDDSLSPEEFRALLLHLVRQELDRVSGPARSAIDLSKVADAEQAFAKGDDAKVLSLLGSWPAPLAIFLRTPEGQSLTPDARTLIAKGLGLLGSSCAKLGEAPQAEEILRLGIQYAADGPLAHDLFRRLGQAYLECGRAGEAIAPLRRSLHFGARESEVLPVLARAYLRRKKSVAALACLRRAQAAGVPLSEISGDLADLERALGPALTRFQAVIAMRSH